MVVWLEVFCSRWMKLISRLRDMFRYANLPHLSTKIASLVWQEKLAWDRRAMETQGLEP